MSEIIETEFEKVVTGNNARKVGYLGVSFTFLFSAFNSAQGLVTQIFSQDGYTHLGQYCIFGIYVAFALSAFFVANIKAQLSHKTGLIIGAFGYLSFLLAGALACYCDKFGDSTGLCGITSIYTANIITGIILGFCAGLLWLSQSAYVNDCTNEQNTGELNGIFWSLCQTSLLLGSLVAAFVLAKTDHFTFYVTASSLAGLAIILFLFVPHVPPKPANIIEVKSIGETVSAFFQTFKNKKMQKLFPLFTSSGLTFAFYATIIPKIVAEIYQGEDDATVNEYSSLVLVALGASELVSGIIIGKLTDKVKKIYIINTANLLVQTAVILSLISFFTQSYFGVIVAGIAWGMAEVSTNVMNTSLIGSDFDGCLEGFTMFRFFMCCGAIIGVSLTIILGDESLYVTILVVSGFQLIFNPILNSYIPKKDQDFYCIH